MSLLLACWNFSSPHTFCPYLKMYGICTFSHSDTYFKITMRFSPKTASAEGYNNSKCKKFTLQSPSVCLQQNLFGRDRAVWLRALLFLKNPAIKMLYLQAWLRAGWGQFLRHFSPWKTTRYHPLWTHLKVHVYSLSPDIFKIIVYERKLFQHNSACFQVLHR